MISRSHPSLRAGAANGGSRGRSFRRRRRLGSPPPQVVVSLLLPRLQVGPRSGAVEAARVLFVQAGRVHL